MRTDSEISKYVSDELSWEASVSGVPVKVEVKDGHVTISGSVDSYPKKIAAEKATMRVIGVRAITNNLKVEIPSANKKPDEQISSAVMDAIKWNTTLDEKKLKVTVKEGWVTLEGEVEWAYQKSRARRVAEDIVGVTGVSNLISVVSTFVTGQDIKNKIDDALKRDFYLSSNNITVMVDGGLAVLTGKVRTLAEKEAAETSAWSAPGITEVLNELVVEYSEVVF